MTLLAMTMELAYPLFISCALWVLFELALLARDAGADRRRDRSSRTLILALIAAGIVIDVLFARSAQPAAPQVLAGMILIWLGLLLRVWAILVLGRFFKTVVTIHRDHEVVEQGPYRLIRHPSYAGALVSFLGLGVALGSLPGLCILVALAFFAFSRRITIEERELSASLGARYRAYMKRTRRLVPFIY